MAGPTTIKRGDSRFYVDPQSKEKYPGVTSILNMLPKPFLKFWAAKLVAEHAVDNFGALASLAVNDKAGAVDWLKRAPQRNTGDAADTGTAVHDSFEIIARGDKLGRVHPDVEPFIAHLHDFHERYQPEYLHIEDTVWSDTHKYAGSFDFLAKIDGETVMGDVKTTRSGVHEEVALQLAAYAHADRLTDQDGNTHEIPSANAGAVLHVRPEGWKLVPVRITPDVFDVFVTLRKVFDWEQDTKKTVLGPADYDSTAKASTGSERRATRR